MKKWGSHQRKWWGKWHLYLGLIAGLIVSIIGITGSILVFQDEIDRKLNPELFSVEANGIYKDYGEILPLVKNLHPELSVQSIMINKGAANPTYRILTDSFQTEIFINPYTGEIIDTRPRFGRFIGSVMDIHRTLMIPGIGRYIVGAASLILLILSITGIRLWLPKKIRQIKSSFTVKFSASFTQQNRSWHNILGVFTFPVVTMLSLSGCVFVMNILILPLMLMLSGNSPQILMNIIAAKSNYSVEYKPLLLSDILDSFQNEEPQAKVTAIIFPRDSVGAYLINAQSPGKIDEGRRVLSSVDQYTGKILFNSERDLPNVVLAYLSWLQPLHYGSFGGIITRILALIGGLAPLILTITGFFIWWPRYTSRKRFSEKNKERVTEKVDVQDQPKVKVWKFFLNELKKGFKYALWILPITFFSGGLYGLFVGILWQPACFAVIFCSFLATFNFSVALITLLFNLLFLVPLKRGKRYILRYFAWSMSIFVVYLIAYFFFSNIHICKF